LQAENVVFLPTVLTCHVTVLSPSVTLCIVATKRCASDSKRYYESFSRTCVEGHRPLHPNRRTCLKTRWSTQSAQLGNCWRRRRMFDTAGWKTNKVHNGPREHLIHCVL